MRPKRLTRITQNKISLDVGGIVYSGLNEHNNLVAALLFYKIPMVREFEATYSGPFLLHIGVGARFFHPQDCKIKCLEK